MYTLKLYYSVQNGGDGSAYPELFESEKLCELDQNEVANKILEAYNEDS